MGTWELIDADFVFSETFQNSDGKYQKPYSHLKPTRGPVQCSLCQGFYSNVSNLRQHVRLVHEPSHQHICLDCNRIFKNDLYLRRHVANCAIRLRKHNGETVTEIGRLVSASCDVKDHSLSRNDLKT